MRLVVGLITLVSVASVGGASKAGDPAMDEAAAAAALVRVEAVDAFFRGRGAVAPLSKKRR